MSIIHWAEKIKPFYRLIFILLLAFLSLGLWTLNSENSAKTPLKIVNIGQTEGNIVQDQSQTVVASKNGTKYYFPWCGALSRIKQENRVSFASPELARNAGYTPAANCKGVK